MHALPLIAALLCALVLAPALLHALDRAQRTRENYRGRRQPSSRSCRWS
jgi:multisubunit Na+/H+ antiporter MnhG subunit